MLRWLIRIVGALALLVVLVLAGGWLWLRTSLPQLDGTIMVAGLSAPVEIRRDGSGVPHIQARSDRDAYFSLGFVHAQDRLWQMDFQRRVAAGRLSEILGARTLSHDRFMRTLGIYRLAERTVEQLSPGARSALDAYAAGVNAYIDNHSGAWPLEFLVLRYQPERWKPADSLVWGRTMGLFLARNWREEILRARLAQRLTPDQLKVVFPPYPADAPRTLAQALSFADPAFGSASNGWVLSGNRSGSGKPLLANDPHLRFGVPAVWYLARIESPVLNFSGATVPGVPFPVLGRNERVAWGFTSAETDVQDLFVERVDPADPARYLTPEGPRPFITRTESIVVRGQADETVTIRATRHGPVITGLDRQLAALAGSGEVIALATPALAQDDRTAEALYRLSRATAGADVREALRDWHSPHLNVLYADASGQIGHLAAARIPIRKSGDGALPSPGWDGSHDWSGYVPFAELPQTVDPPRGVIANANNPPAPADYRYPLGRNVTPGWRARRLEALLAGRDRHNAASSTAIQMDAESGSARAILPLLLPAQPKTPAGRQAQELMRGWDGTMSRDRPQPLIFTAWHRALVGLIFADEMGPDFPAWNDLVTLPLVEVLTEAPGWCDDVATPQAENCADRTAAALDQAAAELALAHGEDASTWRWGDAHQARFVHSVLGRIPLVGGWFDISLPADGGSDTLNRGRNDIDDPQQPYASIHGAGYRGVYDLAYPAQSRFIVTPGQSGNPLSPHYADLARPWRDGEFLLLGSPSREGAPLVLAPR